MGLLTRYVKKLGALLFEIDIKHGIRESVPTFVLLVESQFMYMRSVS